MTLKSIRGIISLTNAFRNYSTSGPLVNIVVNEKTGVATASLQRPPINSINLELITELNNALLELEKNRSKGLILTSSFNGIFSAGMDINELYKPNLDRFKQLWTTMQDAWINLYGSSYPTVAVINGNSPAGGCLFALSCEYRIMQNNCKIGLNETQLGIVAAKWFETSMRNVIGKRQTELALTTGNLFKTDEALKIGLIDEIVESKEEGIEKAAKFLQRFEKIPPLARALTKKSLRLADIQMLVLNREEELNKLIGFINTPKIQKALEIYWESLKQNKKKVNK